MATMFPQNPVVGQVTQDLRFQWSGFGWVRYEPPLPGAFTQLFPGSPDKLPYFSGIGMMALANFTSVARSFVAATTVAAQVALLGLTIGTNTEAWSPDLDALAALPSTGIAVRTAAHTWAQRSLQPPVKGIVITNPDGVSGNPTFALADELAAAQGLATTGILRRTGTANWTAGTLISTAEIAPANITYALIQNATALSILGRGLNSSGVLADIVGTASQVLRVNDAGTNVGFGAIDLAQSAAVTGLLALANGGTNANLTAALGAIPYSTATAMAYLAPTATANQLLLSGASAAPAWSTATYPATTTINQVLYSSAANVVTGLPTVNGGILNTGASGVPSLTATPVLGLAGTTLGSIGFQNLTSGTITLAPVTGALGTVTLLLPAASDQLVGRATTDTLTNKTLTAPIFSTIVNTGVLTLPTSTDTLVGRATTDTLTNKTLTAPIFSTIVNTGTLTLPTSTDTLIGRATTDTLTNKTFDTAGAGNVFKINGTGITDKTGTGKAVLDTNATVTGLTTDVLKVGVNQVVAARVTGWNAPTTGGGAISRGTYDTGATLLTTAETLAALITDLRTHGLIGT